MFKRDSRKKEQQISNEEPVQLAEKGEAPLSSLAEKVRQAGSKVVAAPDSEAEALREKQQNVDEYKQAQRAQRAMAMPEEPAASVEMQPADRVNPMAKYGDRGPEQRVDQRELDEMRAPLGKILPHYAGGGEVSQTGPAELAEGEYVLTPEEKDRLLPISAEAPAQNTGIGKVKSEAPTEPKVEPSEPKAATVEPEPSIKSAGEPTGLGRAMSQEAPPIPTGNDVAADKAYTPPTPVGPQLTLKDQQKHDLDNQHNLIKHDIETAATKGDLAGLGKAKIAEAEFEKAHPWGSEGNHPGILGKIAHGLSVAGNVAGDIFAPGTMELIPGTDLNRRAEENNALGKIKLGTSTDLEKAQADELKRKQQPPVPLDQQYNNALAQVQAATTPAAKAAAQATADRLAQAIRVGKADQKDATLQQQYLDTLHTVNNTAPGTPEHAQAVSNLNEITQTIAQGKTEKPTSEVNLEKTQDVLKQMAGKGYDVTNPTAQVASIKKAKAKGDITEDQANDALSYFGIHQNAPATSVTLANDKGESALNRQLRNKPVLVSTPNGQMQMTGGEADAHGYTTFSTVPPGQAQKNLESNSNTVANLTAINNYKKDLNESKLTPEDTKLMETLVEHGPDAGAVTGLVASLPGVGPTSTAINKFLSGYFTGNEYKNLTPAAQALMADYYTAVISNFSNMQTVLHSLPRNPQMIQTELAAIPKPYLVPDAANPAFDRKIQDMRARAKSVPRISGQDSWQDVENYEPENTTNNTKGNAGGGTSQAPRQSVKDWLANKKQ